MTPKRSSSAVRGSRQRGRTAGRPSLAVVTTVFNAELFIESAIRSVLTQRGVEVEHVIVDDGSSDRTVDVANGISDSRVHVVPAGRVGRARALNLAWHATEQEFVAMLDADDLAHPVRLFTQLRFLQSRPELAAVGTGPLRFDANEAPIWPIIEKAPGGREISWELLYRNPFCHSSMVFRRSALQRVGGYDERRSSLLDWDLYTRLSEVGFQLYKFATPLAAKRVHQQQHFERSATVPTALRAFALQWRGLSRLRRTRLHVPLLVMQLGGRFVLWPQGGGKRVAPARSSV